jgi:hypothetical protein
MPTTTFAITSPLQLLAVQEDQICPLCGAQHSGRICPRIVEIEFYAAEDASETESPGRPVRRIHLFPEEW